MMKLSMTQKKLVMLTLYLKIQTLFNSASDGNPNPKTVLALASDHWPNFCEVLVNVMFGKIVLLIMA